MHIKQDKLKNEKIRSHPFLKEMYDDPYFPGFSCRQRQDYFN